MAAKTFEEYLERYGRDGGYPVIDLDTAIYCPHCKQRCAVALADIPTYEETNR